MTELDRFQLAREYGMAVPPGLRFKREGQAIQCVPGRMLKSGLFVDCSFQAPEDNDISFSDCVLLGCEFLNEVDVRTSILDGCELANDRGRAFTNIQTDRCWVGDMQLPLEACTFYAIHTFLTGTITTVVPFTATVNLRSSLCDAAFFDQVEVEALDSFFDECVLPWHLIEGGDFIDCSFYRCFAVDNGAVITGETHRRGGKLHELSRDRIGWTSDHARKFHLFPYIPWRGREAR